MAYDEELAERIRTLLGDRAGLTEKKMFGGLAFLVGGNMAIAASVVTTIRMPSSDSRRRSRSATSCTSPTPRPSTNVTPASTSPTMLGTPSLSSTTLPFSASTIRSSGTPPSRASCARRPIGSCGNCTPTT